MIDDHPGRAYQTRKRKHRSIQALRASKNIPEDQESQTEVEVGKCLRRLRTEQDLSIRNLAQQSGLNANTLSLIENGKSSPSVSTLQQLANTLNVPITAFFKTDMPKTKISFQKAGQRPLVAFHRGTLEDLGGGLTLHGGQPFIVNLEPKADSGPSPIVHTGHEFVLCLEGHLSYQIEDTQYLLEPGDSLLFEAHLPHSWKNIGDSTLRSLLVLCPSDERDHPDERHFVST